jgi:hypothetical protein
MSDVITTETTPTPAAPAAAPKKTPKATVTLDGTVLTFTFGGTNVRKADATQLTPDLYKRAALHGLEQKLRDTYAGAKTSDEALAMFEKTTEHLFRAVEPSWTAGRDSGPSEDSLDMLAEAIVNAAAKTPNPKDLTSVRAKLEAADKATRAIYRSVPEVIVELAALKAAKATTNTMSVLDSL